MVKYLVIHEKLQRVYLVKIALPLHSVLEDLTLTQAHKLLWYNKNIFFSTIGLLGQESYMHDL